MSDNFESVGGMMQEGKNKALKSLAIGAGVLVYVGMLAYSAVHNYSLLTRGIAPDMVIWAALGVVALELSAAALPIALHWWTHSPLQRFGAFAFYGVDIALILLNVVLDFAIMAGETMPAWMNLYQFFAVPVTPVLAGLGWSLLFLLDPSQRERAMTETLRAATREALGNRIAQAAKSADISESVNAAAGVLARQIVADTLGITRAHTTQRIDAPRPAAALPAAKRPMLNLYKPMAAKARYNTQAVTESPELEGRPNGHKPGLTGQER